MGFTNRKRNLDCRGVSTFQNLSGAIGFVWCDRVLSPASASNQHVTLGKPGTHSYQFPSGRMGIIITFTS